MEEKKYLTLNSDFSMGKVSHERLATDKNIAFDVRNNMVFTSRQIVDLIVCLKNGEIPDLKKYTQEEFNMWILMRSAIICDEKECNLITMN